MRLVLSICLAVLIALGALLFWSAGDPAHIRAVAPLLDRPRMTEADAIDVEVFWPSRRDHQKAEPSGVAVGPDGSIYILHRAGRPFGGDTTPIKDPVIVRLDPQTGEVLARFGAGLFAAPHGLEVANDGSIWVTDIALNTVVRLDGDGRLIQRYGDPYPVYLEALLRVRNWFPRLPVPIGDTTFARPTDVAILSAGRFAVTDGYRNSRLAVFDFDGTLLWQIDSRGSDPGSFHLPHGLTSDHDDRLYVADRRNARIQVFSSEGERLRIIENGTVGRPFGLAVGPQGCLYVADGGDSLDGGDGDRTGLGIMTMEGQAILRVGRTGKKNPDFMLPHDVAVHTSGRAYVADVGAEQVKVIDLSDTCKM